MSRGSNLDRKTMVQPFEGIKALKNDVKKAINMGKHSILPREKKKSSLQGCLFSTVPFKYNIYDWKDKQSEDNCGFYL